MYAEMEALKVSVQVLAVVSTVALAATAHFWMAYRRARRRERRMQREIIDLNAALINEQQRYASARSVLEVMNSHLGGKKRGNS
jgi:Flp pilus assembly protein TadB